MTLYAIGDVQGCREALENLLDVINFDATKDRLWFAGDLVARGPDSLGVLRLVKNLGSAAETVLGNHDLHLLAVHYGMAALKKNDLTQSVLDAPDRDALMEWLRHRPLCLYDKEYDCILTHAGIPPDWSQKETLQRAAEVESVLESNNVQDFFAEMYGNEPAYWNNKWQGFTRLRVITNFLTRLRLVDAQGHMDFHYKEELAEAPENLYPWFQVDNPSLTTRRILFGHWAALKGHTNNVRFIALDTGCVWGGHLTAYRVDDEQLFHSSVGCCTKLPPSTTKNRP